MATAETATRRRGRSEKKRLAILDAAQELFAAGGFDLTSVDAIAARADVSKRTVYDHFGDKETIHTTVVERVAEKLLGTVTSALDDELPSGCDLRSGLLGFVRRVATEAFPSSDYVEFRNLVNLGTARRRVPGSTRNKPKELFTERIERFAAEGAIRTDDPRRAAEHFIALTILLAQDTVDTTTTSAWEAIDSILVDGVDAFMRAYT
ncbi:TetR/AcrR family transcriptional regulator [Mycolicibacterium stellerae]|uniref:TetR/AcrR family transcriptional regulator n=1 Tax=Mycolicibacterium stellerae TaxID=2358193 RepID=UPI0019D07F25|nr:TetR/AcrR family transcriptional regulator [Mycolicibacterium stellerae]